MVILQMGHPVLWRKKFTIYPESDPPNTCPHSYSNVFWAREEQLMFHLYRVTHLIADLDWVDLDLGCSTDRWAAQARLISEINYY